MNEEIEKIKIRIKDLEADKKETTEKKKRRKESLLLYFNWAFASNIFAIPIFITYDIIGLNKIGFIGNVILLSFFGILIAAISDVNDNI